MDHCEHCQHLREGFHGIAVPAQLSRIATLRKDGKVLFRYECSVCGETWDYSRGKGWQTEAAPLASVPLLARLVTAARARIGRSHH